jgi:hypothetical protein
MRRYRRLAFAFLFLAGCGTTEAAGNWAGDVHNLADEPPLAVFSTTKAPVDFENCAARSVVVAGIHPIPDHDGSGNYYMLWFENPDHPRVYISVTMRTTQMATRVEVRARKWRAKLLAALHGCA